MCGCRHFYHEWHVLSAVLAYQLQVVDQEACSDQINVVFPLLVHNLTSPLHKVPHHHYSNVGPKWCSWNRYVYLLSEY